MVERIYHIALQRAATVAHLAAVGVGRYHG